MDRLALAERLAASISDVIANVEHGIPVALVDSLAELERAIRALDLEDASIDAGELAAGVAAIRAGAPDAVNRVLTSATRLVATLRD